MPMESMTYRNKYGNLNGIMYLQAIFGIHSSVYPIDLRPKSNLTVRPM